MICEITKEHCNCPICEHSKEPEVNEDDDKNLLADMLTLFLMIAFIISFLFIFINW